MALYDYRCATCSAQQELFNRVADRDSGAPECCGAPMARQLAAPMVSVPRNCEYKCPVTGTVVTSYRQRDRVMKENNLADANDFTPAYLKREREAKRAANTRLANELYKDIPKEIVQQATAIASDPATA